MTPFLAEILGTFILLLLGVGVCANNSLKHTYAKGTGWILISIGWGLAVFMGVIVAGPISGAHLNPAVTIGLAAAGNFEWSQVPSYILAQLIGAMLGAFCAWFAHKDHYNATGDSDTILGTFSTGPAIANKPINFFNEVLGTFTLVFVVLHIAGPTLAIEGVNQVAIGLGSVGALPVAFLVIAIGMSLGGTTGYAINPTRDLGPRIIHALVPIKHKGKSNWNYAWIPIIGPISGSLVAAGLYVLTS